MDAWRFRPSPGVFLPVTAALVAVVTTSCGSATASSGQPRDSQALAKADCAAVGRALAPPPGQERVWAPKVADAPASGIPALDAAVHRLASALRGRDAAATDHAYSAVVATCGHLGLWQVYHG